MTSIASVALSGLQLAQQRLSVSANNIANAGTEGYRRQVVEAQSQPGGGVVGVVQRAEAPDSGLFVEDVVEQLQARQAFAANLLSLRSEDEMLGRLLDTRA